MVDLSKIAIRGTTQQHLDIHDIASDLVILKDGSVVLILEVSAVNFGLLSEQEQESIIFAYAGFLNSLNFPIQIVIRSRQKDISDYVKSLQDEENRQTDQLVSAQIKKYREFVAQMVKDNNVLDKKFYICIPFSSLEMGVKSASGLFFKKGGLPLPEEEIINRATTTLFPRRDHVLRQMGRLGLKSRQLDTEDLIKLFYTIYNPNGDIKKPTFSGFETLITNQPKT
jgi:hypothetical protein